MRLSRATIVGESSMISTRVPSRALTRGRSRRSVKADPDLAAALAASSSRASCALSGAGWGGWGGLGLLVGSGSGGGFGRARLAAAEPPLDHIQNTHFEASAGRNFTPH